MGLKPRLCVDFDGTVYDGEKLFDGCLEVLAELRKDFRIAIFSARPTQAERDQMIKILAQFNVPVDEILPCKPEAAFYLDDKGRQFQGWDKVLEQVGLR